MEESVTHQAILRRGRESGLSQGELKAAREILLRLGRRKFQTVPPQVETTVNAIADLARLESLSERVLDANSWDELLRSE